MEVKRRFVLGEEWLYIKIYTGHRVQELLLANEIQNLVDIYYSDNLINAFFFVRYSDQDGSHLRIRFKLNSIRNISPILQLFNEKIILYVDRRIIHKIIYDTYVREIERYGVNNIEDLEIVFSYDSQLILTGLKNMYSSGTPDNRWIWGVRIMDDLLSKFGLNYAEKHMLYEEYYKLYEHEFKLQSLSKKKIAEKYRKVRETISKALFEDNNKSYLLPNESFILNVDSSINRLLERYSMLDNSIILRNGMLKNLLHMHYNRLFTSHQRTHELVIYFVMSKVYKSCEIRMIKA